MTVIHRIRAVILVFCALTSGKSAAAEIALGTNEMLLARIALLSDPHVNLATNGLNAEFKRRFEKAIKQVNAEKVDFVLIAGDLTQSGRAEEFVEFKRFVKQLEPAVLFVPGNHDVGHKFNSGQKTGTVTPERVAAYEKTFGSSFFAKKVAGMRIVGINSSLLSSGFERELGQWKFLKKEFEKPSRTPTILFMHYPLFLKNPSERGGDYYNTEPVPRTRLLELLKQSGVKIVLTGHLHRSLVNRDDGILFLTTPPISFGLPRGKQQEGWTKIEVFKSGETKETFRAIE